MLNLYRNSMSVTVVEAYSRYKVNFLNDKIGLTLFRKLKLHKVKQLTSNWNSLKLMVTFSVVNKLSKFIVLDMTQIIPWELNILHIYTHFGWQSQRNCVIISTMKN
jgi:hypothetical protein